MNATPYEKANRRSWESEVDLRTIPSGWNLSSLYAPSANCERCTALLRSAQPSQPIEPAAS